MLSKLTNYPLVRIETGRNIPESEVVRSLQSPEESIRLLAPKTDLVIRIRNEATIKLTCVEDYSGNWHNGMGAIYSQQWCYICFFIDISITISSPQSMELECLH